MVAQSEINTYLCPPLEKGRSSNVMGCKIDEKQMWKTSFQKSLESKKGRAIFASAFRVRGKRGVLEVGKTE
jgi:hypothetical protein